MKESKYRLYFNCVLNDTLTVEISHGLDMYAGYEFVVYEEDKDDMIKFIEETIESNGLPIDNIHPRKLEPDNQDKVDTKEDVVRKVLAGKDDILRQIEISESDYGKNLRDGKVVEAVNIYAFCVLIDPNTPEEACWSRYEGFRFTVKKEDAGEMMKFIYETIISNGLPLIKMCMKNEELINERHTYTKEGIVRKILSDKNDILKDFNKQLETKKK